MIPLLIAGGAALGGAIANAIGSSNAANAQQKQIDNARAILSGTYQQQQRDLTPFMQGGQSTLADLLAQMKAGGFNSNYQGLDPSQIANDPGFQFRMQQGQQALERSAAARGGLMSGGFAKDLANYSQGLASTEYGNAWQRNMAENQYRQGENQNRFNRMFGLVNEGQNAATNLAGMAGQYGSNMANLYGAKGNAQAAGAIGASNAVANGFSQIGGMALGGYGGGMGGLMSNIPRQGQSTGYVANIPAQDYSGGYRPRFGFGLNYGND